MKELSISTCLDLVSSCMSWWATEVNLLANTYFEVGDMNLES